MEEEAGVGAVYLAIADFYDCPHLENVDTKLYHGHVGEPLTLTARDNRRVESISFNLYNAQNEEVECGEMEPTPICSDSRKWVFVSTCGIETCDGTLLVTIIKSLEGNTTQIRLEVNLDQEVEWMVRPSSRDAL